MMGWCSCSFPFLFAPVLIAWGVCVLVTAVGILSITSSFFEVFPFGTPLWLGTLFIALGCFMLAVFRPREQPLVKPSKGQVVFTFFTSVVTMLEVLLAIGLSIWYFHQTFPALEKCSLEELPANSNEERATCLCDGGFVNPPSLLRIVYRFNGVEDCSGFGRSVVIFRSVLFGLYFLGGLISVAVIVALIKKLKKLCGKSGIYLVTPTAPSSNDVSRQPSFASSHPSTHGSSLVNQRWLATSLPSTSTPNHSPATHHLRPRSVTPHALI